MAKKNTSVTVRGSYNLIKPSEMATMANILKRHIVQHKLYTPIVGKNYVQVEGWQFAGSLMGLFPMVTEITNLSKDSEMKWQATVEIRNIKTGEVVGRGFAICSNKENKKKTFDEYAILSMAQTRATGKAYRNLIGWVMKLAGYEGTPSEEMVKAGEPVPVAKTPKSTPPNIEAECNECANPMTKAEAIYSEKMFGKRLCRDCQAIIKSQK